MARINIDDLPVNQEIDQAEAKGIFGGRVDAPDGNYFVNVTIGDAADANTGRTVQTPLKVFICPSDDGGSL